MDKDGYISNGELFQVLKMMVGNNLKDTQLQQIVDKTIINADKDGDGRISFEEFCAVSLGTPGGSGVVGCKLVECDLLLLAPRWSEAWTYTKRWWWTCKRWRVQAAPSPSDPAPPTAAASSSSVPPLLLNDVRNNLKTSPTQWKYPLSSPISLHFSLPLRSHFVLTFGSRHFSLGRLRHSSPVEASLLREPVVAL